MKNHLYSYAIETAAVLDRDPRWEWDLEESPERRSFVLWLITGGKGTLTAGPDFYNLTTGDCLISPLCQAHHGRHDDNNRLTIFWVRYNYLGKNGNVIMPEPMPVKYRLISQVGFLRTLMQRTNDAFYAARPGDAHRWFGAVLMEIARADEMGSLQAKDRQHSRQIHEIAEQIREKPEATWELNMLSNRLAMTPDHFIRVFKRFIGETPHEHVIRCRIEAACNLLHFTGMSISAISAELSFCDVHYFSRQFAARMGISPLRFRKKG